MSATTDPPAAQLADHAARHACGIACTGSTKPVAACVCECAGQLHGMLRLAPEQRPGHVPGPRRDPFTRLPTPDDEPW